MYAVMQNQGLATPRNPVAALLLLSANGKRMVIALSSPSRIWGVIGKTTNGIDVMVHLDLLAPLISHTNPVAVPVLKGPELPFHADLKRSTDDDLGKSRFLLRSSVNSDPATLLLCPLPSLQPHRSFSLPHLD